MRIMLPSCNIIALTVDVVVSIIRDLTILERQRDGDGYQYIIEKNWVITIYE
jgi:hypothetical protein